MYTSDENHFSLLMQVMVGLAIAFGVGWALVKARRGIGRIDAVLLFVIPGSIFALLGRSLLMVLNLDQVDWLSGRLAPALAILKGYTIYYPRDSGPIFNTIYPPMGYLVYLPAGLMPGPTSALIAGNSISYLLVLAPILLLCLVRHGEEDRNRSLLVSLTVFLAFWKSAMVSPMLAAFTIHADAPAFGFGMMSCVLLYMGRRSPSPSNRVLFGSALCATLALWSKQTTVPLLVVLPLWIFLTHGFHAAIRFLGWIVATVTAVTAALVAALGFEPMRFNILEIPKNHPLILFPNSKVKPFLVVALEEWSICLPTLLAIVVTLVLTRRRWKSESDEATTEALGPMAGLRAWFRANHWSLFTAAGLAMFPLAMLSRIKFGGAYNNYAPPLYYFSASACVLVLDLYARNRERGLGQVNDMMKVGLLVSSFSPLLLLNFETLQHIGVMRVGQDNFQEQAYNYALKHPHETYFPWNPLSTLMAEGRAYNFEYGVFDRDLAQAGPTPSHYLSGLPEKMRLVAYPPNRIMEYSMILRLADFKRRVQVPELPGWICYER